MNRKQLPLEPFIAGMNGATFPRCQARAKATGAQCKKPAVTSFRVCTTHGAGSRKRTAAGERRAPGRPVEHGRYSVKGLKQVHELMGEVERLEADLDNSDRELIALKAVLWYLLEHSATYHAHQERLEALLAKAVAKVGATPVVKGEPEDTYGDAMTLAEAREAAAELAEASRLLARIEGWSGRLSDSAVKVITMIKARAKYPQPNPL